MSSNLLILFELLLVLGIVLGFAAFELASLRRPRPPDPDASMPPGDSPPGTVDRQGE